MPSCAEGKSVPTTGKPLARADAVRQAVETVTPEQQTMIVKELEENVLRCVKDANGNHVSCYHPYYNHVRVNLNSAQRSFRD